MKNLLKKLHIMPYQSEDFEDFSSSKTSKFGDVSSPEKLPLSQSPHNSEQKPFSALSGWLNSVTCRGSPSPMLQSSSHVTRGEMIEQSDSAKDSALDVVRHNLESTNLTVPDITEEDPEAVKQISLGSCPPENTPSEVIAFQYWASVNIIF